MTKTFTKTKKLLSVLLCIALMASYLPSVSWSASAAPAFAGNKVSDTHTLHNWETFFGKNAEDANGDLSSENAGGVWGDKSVFADDAIFGTDDEFKNHNITLSDENDFLVVLSAIAANKTIVGYSAIPTDTMLVLDLSNSMSDSSVRDMVQATNSAIRRLKELNYNNRVGVVLYAGSEVQSWGGPGGNDNDVFGLSQSATVILPLDRYTGVGTGDNETFLSYNNDRVSVVSGVLDGNDDRVASNGKSASGATYIQSGMWMAWKQFEAVPKSDTVITSGVQKGTTRMPVMVLMSDGAPTAATSSFDNVGNSNRGDGSSSSADSINAFFTQLTNAWALAKVEDHYEREALFYTLGLNVSDNENAVSVLEPNNASTTIQGYWNAYLAATTNGAMVNLKEPDAVYEWGNQEYTIPGESFTAKRDTAITAMNYVTEYFSATTGQQGNGLINAFESIVNQIIIQSKYYPTLVDEGDHNLDGYITFTDELGEYMEVKNIKGLTVHGDLYKGSRIAQAIAKGSFGDVSDGDLSNLTKEGLAVLSAVQKRLNCTEEQAKTVLSQALAKDQLSYTSETNYSNYIGWFADADGNYLGFWDGDPNSTLSGAAYANKSYGFLGEVGSAETYDQTDMLYISVQVHKNLATGHEQVLYKIPASLVPIVTYEVDFKGDDLATGTDFQMSVIGAEAPLRLIYEVGLRSDINPLNIAEKVDAAHKNADGTYTFYTNAWGAHAHTHTKVDSHDATTLDFSPSMENERYYYTTDATIYDAQGNAVKSDPRNASGPYYHEMIVFTTESAAMTAATMKTELVPIAEGTLNETATEAADGTWYIPKGTPYRLLSMYQVSKGNNETQTLQQVFFPDYVLPTATNDYYVDACLGNNGKFTVQPAQGIRLSKTMEFAEVGAGETFIFDMALSDAVLEASYPYTKYDAEGKESSGNATVTAGVATVQLKAGEVLYLTGLPTGATYTVTERAHDGYVVKTATGTTGTVEAYTLHPVAFQNTPRTTGDLIISKAVTHDFGSGFAVTDKGFDIEVALDGVANGTKYTVTGVPNVTEAAVQNGKLAFTIKHGQTIAVHGIEDGVKYTVTEAAYTGFTLGGTGLTGTIDTAANQEAHLVNHYDPAPVPNVNITLNGTKGIDGRAWQAGDEFTFRLQYFDGSNWTNVGNPVTVAYNAAGNYTFDLSSALQGFPFAEPDNYEFRVMEDTVAANGMISDPYEKKFEVTVVDDNLSGYLKISNVTTTTANTADHGGTTVSTTANGFAVTTAFVNRYNATGITEVIVNITKQITNDTKVEVPYSGFTFDLYRVDGNNEVKVLTSDPTDAHGLTSIALVYDAYKGQIITYRLKETKGSIEGMTYDETVKEFTVEIYDNNQGGVNARINTAETHEYAATFTNVYELDDAELTLEGEKQITNDRPIGDGEFAFELFECDDLNFTNPVSKAVASNVGDKFSFDLTYDQAGLYYYVLREQTSGLSGITDDTAEFRVVVQVGKGVGKTLEAKVVAVVKNGVPTDEGIVFVNEYESTDATYTLAGMKNLTGRTLKAGEFTFLLYKADDQFNVQGAPVQVVNNEDGLFTFEELTFDTVGTYRYVVVEDDSVKKGGVTYDDTEYRVTITVVDNWDGTKTATATGATVDGPANALVFNNTYVHKETAVKITGTKTLTGATLTKDAFTFHLYEVLQSRMTDAPVRVATNDADGNIEFGTIELHSPGVYTYKVVEDSSAQAQGITYDDTVYYVTVTVTDDQNGNLVAEVAYTADNAAAEGIAFVNVYTPAPQPEPEPTPNPETGDNSLFMWFAVLFVSGVGVFAANRKKRTAN